MEWTNGDYLLSDDYDRIDLEWTMDILSTTYWAGDRSREVMERGIRNSVCFGLFLDDKQVGFARGLTDEATFCWIADVIVDPDHRGKGLGKWMVEQVINHPKLQTCSQVLGTKDAHTLYERFGFNRSEYLKRSLTPSN